MRALLGALTASTLLLTACAGGSVHDGGESASSDGSRATTAATAPAPTTTTKRAAKLSQLAYWPMYHGNGYRSGHVASGPVSLRTQWTKGLTGAVYGEPVVIGSTLVVATEKNWVYGLEARTGAERWSAQLGTPQARSGLPCGNIDPLGITGTPAYDKVTGSVFVVAETSGGTHTLWALDATSGERRWHRTLDTQTNRNKLAEQQRSALLVTSGRVITTFGGLAGDCDNYVGYATSVATDGQGATTSYAVPTAREAGMWSPPGAVVAEDRRVYVASGNGAEEHGTWDKSDSVTRLTPVNLHVGGIFAPGSWKDDNIRDLDLGSSSPAVVRAVHRVVIAGKRGTAYLLKPTLGGVAASIDHVGGCQAYGGTAVVGQTVLMPCKGETSIRALHVTSGSLSWSWTRSGVYGSPVVAGDRVYVADRGSGDLVVLSLATGAVIGRHHAGPLPHFPSQVVSGDWVFVPTTDGITAFLGH